MKICVESSLARPSNTVGHAADDVAGRSSGGTAGESVLVAWLKSEIASDRCASLRSGAQPHRDQRRLGARAGSAKRALGVHPVSRLSKTPTDELRVVQARQARDARSERRGHDLLLELVVELPARQLRRLSAGPSRSPGAWPVPPPGSPRGAPAPRLAPASGCRGCWSGSTNWLRKVAGPKTTELGWSLGDLGAAARAPAVPEHLTALRAARQAALEPSSRPRSR